MGQDSRTPQRRLRFADRFDLLRLLGRGAHARVYAAHDQHFNRLVAIKIFALQTRSDTPSVAALDEARSRFDNEARTAQRLQHPDIVRVLEAGLHEGQAWLSMELVPGSTLQRYTDPARLLPEPAVLRAGQRIALALEYAHSQRVVHRDLKPANVLVDWPSDTLKLVDFGLARADDTTATRTGLMLGTPQYMSPELLAGDRPDARSDYYALGVILFELLTARLPFDTSNMGELLRRAAREAAPDLRQIQPQTPAALAELLAEMLATQPSQRLADGARIAGRLRSLRLAWSGGAMSR
jgi:eukaryotic-like serine/threonine-protein kinase